MSSEEQLKQTKSQQYQDKYITFIGFIMNKEPENNIEIIGKYERQKYNVNTKIVKLNRERMILTNHIATIEFN